MPLKIGISCAIISVSRWIPALKRSPLWVKPKAEKAYAKERTGYIPQDAIPKMGNSEKILQVAARSQAKKNTTTGHMLCCWKPGCARVTDWFDWGRHQLGEAYSYRQKWG